MTWFVYILRSARGQFYVGVTTDIERRINEHNGTKKGGAKYTMANRPYTLVWSRVCASRSEAQTREYALKRLTHKEKEELALGEKGNVTKKTKRTIVV